MNPTAPAVLILIAFLLLPKTIFAATPRLVRGPYLQCGTPTSIIVRWRTDVAVDSRVEFGLAVDARSAEVRQDALTTEHILTLTNLIPNTHYFYAVGTTELNLAEGAGYSFFTAPTNAKPTRIWAIGDSGTASQPGYEGMAAGVRDAYYAYTGTRPTDVWLMLGDNAYLAGTDAQFQAELFDVYTSLLRQSVLWPCLGNHDVNYSGFPYMKVFSLPSGGEAGGVASGSTNYYSFDYGNIHFVCLDSEISDRSITGPMLAWLQQDLSADHHDWLIAFWHSPPYTKGSHDSDTYDTTGEMIDMRGNALPILEAHGVDLVLGGHSHDYERSYLLDGHYGLSATLVPSMVKDSGNGRPADAGAYLKAGIGATPHQGAVYVVVGSSGWVTPLTYTVTAQHPAMYITNRELGSLIIDVASNRLDAVFLRDTGAIHDSFTIIKGAAPEPLRWATFKEGQGLIKAQWKSVAGQTYRVERSLTLDASDWQEAAVVTASGATSGWTNALPVGALKAFYRVVKLAN